MHPAPVRTSDGGAWPADVVAVLQLARSLTTDEILELARRQRHDHGPGPCPAAPTETCRTEATARVAAIVRTAAARADAGAAVRRLRGEVEAAIHAAADPHLLRAEPVVGVLGAAAEAASHAALASLLVDRMSPENAALLRQPWSAIAELRTSPAGGVA